MEDATSDRRTALRPFRRVVVAAASAALGTALMSCAPTQAPPAAPSPPSAARGEAIALRMCNDCHQISPTRPSTSEDAGPSFMAIANQPGRNRTELIRLLTEWHGLETLELPDIPMPTFMLTSEQRDDVVGYILSFQTGRESAQRPTTGLKPSSVRF